MRAQAREHQAHAPMLARRWQDTSKARARRWQDAGDALAKRAQAREHKAHTTHGKYTGKGAAGKTLSRHWHDAVAKALAWAHVPHAKYTGKTLAVCWQRAQAREHR